MAPIGKHICQVEVRGYELDSYEHVNHAEYVRYLEHARWKYLEAHGVTLARLGEWKRWPVIAHLDVTYKKPAFMSDVLDIETEVVSGTLASFTIEQRILRQGVVILLAKIKAVIVNEHGRPADMPAEIAHLIPEPK